MPNFGKSLHTPALAPDGRMWVQFDAVGNAIKVHEFASAKERFTLAVPQGFLDSMAFAPDGTTLAAVIGMADKSREIHVLNVRTGKSGPILKSLGRIQTLAFAPNGKTLASAGRDQPLRLWELSTGKERLVLPDYHRDVSSIVFAPDSKRVAVAQSNTIKILEAATGKLLTTLRSESPQVAGMVFSPDGKRLASGGGLSDLGRGTGVKLWDLSTGREILNLAATQTVSHVAFSPDGKRLAASFSDKLYANPFGPSRPAEVKIWNAGDDRPANPGRRSQASGTGQEGCPALCD